MDFNMLEALLYGFLSGITEILPVSSLAHQAILVQIFNEDANVSLLNFMVHAGILAGIWITCGSQLSRAYKAEKRSRAARYRNRRNTEIQNVLDFRLVKTAFMPMLIGFCVYGFSSSLTKPLYWISIFFLLNGIILHIPMYIPHGNKDSRSMTRLDSTLIGLGSMLAVLPGVSRTGTVTSFSIGRGAEPSHAFRWSLFLGIPAMAILMCFDAYQIFAYSMAGIGFPEIIQSLSAAAAAVIGTILAVSAMRFLSARAAYLNFCYYSYGVALFSFILWINI